MAGDARQIELPALAKRFVVWFAGFAAIGAELKLALADARPGTLLALLPKTVRLGVVPVSVLLITVIALAVQYYGSETLPKRRTAKRFRALMLIASLGAVVLLLSWLFLVKRVSVPAEDTEVYVLIWFWRSASCGCESAATNLDCLRELGPTNAAAVESCWGNPFSSEAWLTLVYLATISAWGCLVGLVTLQWKARRSHTPRNPRKPRGGGTKTPRPSA